MKILSLFVRRDGAGHAYSLSTGAECPERHFARNMFKTPGESFPGARAFEAWRRVDFWVVPPTCRTVLDGLMLAQVVAHRVVRIDGDVAHVDVSIVVPARVPKVDVTVSVPDWDGSGRASPIG